MWQFISQAELSRLQSMSIYEDRLAESGFVSVAGVDEVGRGCLAGPVVAAACILPKNALFEHLNDSKQLTPAMRDRLYSDLTSHPELCFGLGIIDVATIDSVNILQATFLAMQQAVASLKISPDYLLIDGNQVPVFKIPTLAIVEGDAHSISIAAASVLAKVTRDRMMAEFDRQWPLYGFRKHKGYATASHLHAIRTHGPCSLHRKSFEPIKSFVFDKQMSFL